MPRPGKRSRLAPAVAGNTKYRDHRYVLQWLGRGKHVLLSAQKQCYVLPHKDRLIGLDYLGDNWILGYVEQAHEPWMLLQGLRFFLQRGVDSAETQELLESWGAIDANASDVGVKYLFDLLMETQDTKEAITLLHQPTSNPDDEAKRAAASSALATLFMPTEAKFLS